MLLERAANHLPDTEAVHRLGMKYLSDHPGEAGSDTLVGLLLETLSTRKLSRKTFAVRLREAVSADFAAGHVENYDGWILARTEMRFFALATEVTLHRHA